MYVGLLTPTLYIRSYAVQDRGYTNFREYVLCELRRTPVLRRWVNKAIPALVFGLLDVLDRARGRHAALSAQLRAALDDEARYLPLIVSGELYFSVRFFQSAHD